MDYSRVGLRTAHFNGFVPIKSLAREDVLGHRGNADVEGVYIVLRPARTRPDFIEDDHPQPRLPVMDTTKVASRWPVDSPEVLYIGKAPLRGREGERRSGLANRMLEFQKCGMAGGTNHFGGRLIWRIADRDRLLICWKCLPEGTAADVESLMIAGFKGFNQLKLPPFANIGAPKKYPDKSRLSLIAAKGC